MNELMRRKHQRCVKDTAITYTFLNQAAQYEAIARNHSRFGMYFETYKSLVPGTLIVIRNTGAGAELVRDAAAGSSSADPAAAQACRELKTQVVGEVKRCEKIEEASKPRYGIAVHYVSPAA